MVSPLWAIEPFVVHDIKIEGLEHTETEAVFKYLPLKVGDTFYDATANKLIKSLFDTSFFDDVRVACHDKDVVITVVERPIIAELNVEGARALNGAQIKKALKDSGVGESLTFNQALFEAALQSLKQAYFNNGQYDVDIAPKMTPLEHNRLAITLRITEGASATIREIRVVGAKALNEQRLLKEFSLTTGGLFSWYSHDNQYVPEKLQNDIERLKKFYRDRGFMKMDVNSTQVLMSPDKKFIYVLINISEGNLYKVGDIRFSGDVILPEAILRELLQFKSGDIFHQMEFTSSVNAIVNKLGEIGYAFAKVNIVPESNEETGRANFDINIQSGHQTYVRYINIVGNNHTKDEVIRREIRQMEQSVFDRRKIDRSEERIRSLGYIGSATITTKAVQDMPDTVDLEVAVTDSVNGRLGLDFHRVENQGITPIISFNSPNLLGSGKALLLDFSTNETRQTAQLSYYVPYITPDAVNFGYRAGYERSKVGPRTETSVLSELKMLVPISEYDHIRFGFGKEYYGCEGDSAVCQQYEGKAENLVGSVAWGQDTRDKTILPTQGSQSNLSFSIGLPGGDSQYYTLSYEKSLYVPLSELLTLALHGEIETGSPYGDTEHFPTFKNFKAGGIGSIRGFEEGSLGEHKPVENGEEDQAENFGSSRKFIANAELWFPVLGIRQKDTVQLGVFVDTASLWGPSADTNNPVPQKSSEFTQELRLSSGLCWIWKSPIGPIAFSYTLWRDHQEHDDIKEFQFSIGMTGF